MTTQHKSPLRTFLNRNRFESPLTLGFFYREKMRPASDASPADVDAARVDATIRHLHGATGAEIVLLRAPAASQLHAFFRERAGFGARSTS
jgi:hypothetical protein